MYRVKHPEKYIGDSRNVVYRSLWERNTFRWLDDNPNIVKFSSEEIVIPYLCGTDNKVHRYFVDVYFETVNGDSFLIEIKPEKELYPPKKPKRKSKRYLTESLTYMKNQSKWEAAKRYAEERGWTFEVWTEKTLRTLGIKILGK